MYALAPPPMQSDQTKLWLAVAVSLAVHLSLYVWWPHSKLTIPPLEKITINLSVPPPAAQRAAPPPPPAQPQVTQPKPVTPPKPATPKVERPVLSAPSSNSDYTVAEKPAEPVVPSPVETKAAAVEVPAPSNSAPSSKPSVATSSSTSVVNANAEEATSSEAWDGYGKDLYDLVGKSKTYPAMAIRRHWEGEVKVRAKFVLGKLQDIVILDASGHAVLDTAALEMVTKAINQLPVKGVLSKKSFTVEIPVSFKLEA
jgi:periplasmic protein TonB